MSKPNVKKKLRHAQMAVSGWNEAILDAEQMIVKERQKIADLKQAIKAFSALRDAGRPFPRAAGEERN